MRGSNYRAPCPSDKVRVIRFIDDSTQDRFITPQVANRLIKYKILRPVNVGRDYPNTYLEKPYVAGTSPGTTQHP